VVLVLAWNLFHGRAQPPAGRALDAPFAATLAGWDWDVALLQEVPPWWPAPLAAACGAQVRAVRTSRNAGLPLRRAVARRAPDLIKSNGGGANAILVRGRAIHEHRMRRLCRRPERRWAHGVALPGGEGWVVNLHASTHPPGRNAADLALAAEAARAWAGSGPLILGGDLNATYPRLAGLRHVAGHHVDHVLVAGWVADEPGELLDAGPLSDHRPLRVGLRPA
jgi:endonuclease/exonuclease/phosphatase family metal-dependent hydrolase